jgi:chaperonin GroES
MISGIVIIQLVNMPIVPAARVRAPLQRQASSMATKQATSVTVGPLADRVVVRSLEGHEQTRGGLFIPDTAKEKPQEGEILAVGPGRFDDGKRVPMEVKVGDKVLFGKYSGTEVVIDGEPLLILRESDVLAILT